MATNDDACGQNCDKSNERLITDTIDLTGYSSVHMRFDRFFQELNFQSQPIEEAMIEISLDSGSTWNTLKTLSGDGKWVTQRLDLSSYTGNSGALIAFKYNDNGGWVAGFAVDNVHIYEPADPNVALNSLDINSYVSSGSSVGISGTFKNLGSSNLSSVTVKWQADGGTVHSENLSGLGLAPFGSSQFTHQDQLSMPNPANKDLTVWVESPNGATDQQHSNDTLGQSVSALSNIPTKHVLVEEATGAWCKFCPDGAVKLKNTVQDNPNTYGVSVHDNDPMEIPDGATTINAFVGGFPSGLVDRKKFDGETSVELSRNDWNSYAGTREGHVVPVSVSTNSSYDTSTREISVDVTADFYGPVNEELRLNAYIVEDHVSDSTDSGYDQANYYDTESGHPYYQAGDPVVGYDHRHVLREMLGGAWGTSGVIPNSGVSDGDSYTKTYTYNLPSDFKAKDIVVIGLVQKYDSDVAKRPIWNAKADSSVMEDAVASVEDRKAASASLNVYPNPVSDRAKVDIRTEKPVEGRIEIRDMMGRIVRMERSVRIGPGASYMPIDMSDQESGMYTLRFITDQGSSSERFSVIDE